MASQLWTGLVSGLLGAALLGGSSLLDFSLAPGGSETLCPVGTEKRHQAPSQVDGGARVTPRVVAGALGTESVTLSGTGPGWEPPEDPDTGSECSHPEASPSPRFVAAKTQANQSGKKVPASVVRCATLLHRTPPATQTQTFRTPNSGSPASKATAGTDGLRHPTRPPSPPTVPSLTVAPHACVWLPRTLGLANPNSGHPQPPWPGSASANCVTPISPRTFLSFQFLTLNQRGLMR